MLYSKTLAAATVLTGLAVTSVNAIATISTYGSKFFDSDGNQFFVKGIAYQLTEDDPLIDGDQCARDATLMQTLGANTIRVYHVDPSGDHDACMSSFADAGIYLFLDLDTFNTAISPLDTYWNETQVSAYSKVMDAFADYENTLGFFVGNEVIAMANESNAAPYIKAAIRDMKAHRNSKNYREIPIGYSAADIAELRPMLQNYLACGGNSSESTDFFGLNAYEWCGDSSYTVSGYSTLNEEAQGYSVPIFFSETGCQTIKPRTFEDQTAILGSDMNEQWSGAIVYEWIEEANDYGLISYGPTVAATATASNVVGGYSRGGSPTPVSPDFDNLKSQWSTLTPTGTPSSAYTPDITTPTCPSSTASGWLVDGDVALPTIGATLSTSGSSGTATTTSSKGSSTGTATGSAASASSTKGSASGSKEIAGMSAGLVAVMCGFMYWL